ncbi:MAG: TonB-dependent receptor, partial [Pyrinomonadaceae bacterium]|nr:TonB-dependent receptor [Pyrinomonadaceae bacterium]
APERNFGGFFNRQHRESRRYELLEIYNLPAQQFRGQHTLRLGVNFSRTAFQGTDTSDPVRILRRDATTSQLIAFSADGRLDRNSNELALFAQDKWNVNNRLTLDLGVRFDRDSIGSNNNIAPRAGFVVLPFANARTIVRGGIGLFYDKIPLGVGAFEQRQNLVVTDFQPDGATPLGAPRLFRNAVENGRFRNPRSIAGNIQIDRELTKRILLRLGYSERRTIRDFIVEQILTANNENLLLLSNKGRSRYREFEITTQFQLQERRNLNLSYVRSRASGDLNDFDSYFGNARNPVIRPNEFSLLPFDAPHRLLFTGDIGLPYDLTLYPVVDWRSGFPYSIIDENRNFVGGRNRGGRFPQFFSLDLQVSKGLQIPVPSFKVVPAAYRGKKVGVRIGFKIFNLTNNFNPRDVQNNLASPNFGTFYNSPGRTFRAKFEFVNF